MHSLYHNLHYGEWQCAVCFGSVCNEIVQDQTGASTQSEDGAMRLSSICYHKSI